MKKTILTLVYIVLLIYPFYVVWNGIPPALKQNINRVFVLGYLYRSLALSAFIALGAQIILGVTKLDMKLHFKNGIVAYTLLFLHTFLQLIFFAVATKKIDPFYIYTDFCLLCKGREFYVTLGRFAFWGATLVAFVGKFRNIDSLKNKWQFLHRISYVVFPLVSIHAYFIGSDIHSPIFFPLYIFLNLCVFGSLIFKSRKSLGI